MGYEREIASYYPEVLRTALHVLHGDKATAEDVVQNVMVIFVRYSRRTLVRDVKALLNWILQKQLRTHFVRAKKNAQRTISLEGYDVPVEPTAPSLVLAREILDEIQELSPEHRGTLLAILIGLSVEDIADRDGVPVNTVKTRAHYARASLRKIREEIHP
jgi:RNA polymerase sigma-70 factor (ECF subfamily)